MLCEAQEDDPLTVYAYCTPSQPLLHPLVSSLTGLRDTKPATAAATRSVCQDAADGWWLAGRVFRGPREGIQCLIFLTKQILAELIVHSTSPDRESIDEAIDPVTV